MLKCPNATMLKARSPSSSIESLAELEAKEETCGNFQKPSLWLKT